MPTEWKKRSNTLLNKVVLFVGLVGVVVSVFWARRTETPFADFVWIWGAGCAYLVLHAFKVIVLPVEWKLVLDSERIYWGVVGRKQIEIQTSDIKRIIHTTGDTNDSLIAELNDAQKVNIPFSGTWGFVEPEVIIQAAKELGIPTEKIVK